MLFLALNTLLDQVRPRYAPDLRLAATEPGQSEGTLYSVEAAAISRAVIKRRNEFIAGRLAARAAMQDLGVPSQPIPMAEDRSPIWPPAITGSISHTEFAAIAAVTHQARVQGVGIDLEADTPLGPDLIAGVCRPEERSAFSDDLPLQAKRIFCAKEAAYKAQYPVTASIYGFESMRTHFVSPTLVEVTFVHDVLPFKAGDRLSVRQWVQDGVILSLCVIPVVNRARPSPLEA